MNRREEYWNLVAQLSEEPPELEGSVQRAIRRAKRQRRRRPLRLLGSLAGVCAAFVLMVNASPAFALSCGGVPILKELAAAVSFSPSLKNAILHDYVQYVGQSDTVDGVTLELDSIIADRRQMVVFYRTVESTEDFSVDCKLKNPEGNDLDGYSVSSPSSQEELKTFTLYFHDSPPPLDFTMELRLQSYPEEGHEPPALGPFAFSVHLDPDKTAQPKILSVNKWFTLDGQDIWVDRLEITPTCTVLYLDDAPDNTAWLQSLDFYFTDKPGNRYDQLDGGLAALGRPDNPGTYTYYHQSLYFLDSMKGLKLHVEEATWLDKDAPPIALDLTSCSADWKPEYIRDFSLVEEMVDGKLQRVLWVTADGSHFPLARDYYDPEGGVHTFNRMGVRNGYTGADGLYHSTRLSFVLEDYPWDSVTLELDYTSVTRPDPPLEVPLS